MKKLTSKLSSEKLGFYQDLLLKCSPNPRRRNKYMHGLRNDIYKLSICFSLISVSRTTTEKTGHRACPRANLIGIESLGCMEQYNM